MKTSRWALCAITMVIGMGMTYSQPAHATPIVSANSCCQVGNLIEKTYHRRHYGYGYGGHYRRHYRRAYRRGYYGSGYYRPYYGGGYTVVVTVDGITVVVTTVAVTVEGITVVVTVEGITVDGTTRPYRAYYEAITATVATRVVTATVTIIGRTVGPKAAVFGESSNAALEFIW